MELIFGGLIQLIFFAAIVAAVVYGIRAITRHSRDFPETDPGIGTVRRLYFYVVSFVALMMTSNGIIQTARFVLDASLGGDVISPSRVGLAIGLSLTIVGLPLWAVHWRIIGRLVSELPVETRSILRKIYIYAVLAVAAGIAIGAAVDVLQWIFGGQSFKGYPWAALVVMSAVWAFHWRLESQEGQSTPQTRAVRRLYIYLMAAGTLATAALGLGQIVHTFLREAYSGLTSVSVLAPSKPTLWGTPTRDALALLLVAGPVWVAHWLYFARRDYESTLRQLYLFAFALLGSVATALTALGIMLYGVLEWTIGVPDDESAAAHFRFLPGAMASLIIGGIVLAYHWMAAEGEAKSPTLEMKGARRSYPYVLTAVGLVVLVVGIATLVNTALGIFVESGRTTIAGRELWKNGVALGITLVVLGTPIWAYFWGTIQRSVSAGDLEERTHIARRIFTFAILGAGMLALLGSISFLVFVFLRELLDGRLSEVLREAKVSISIIVPVAIFLPYYWMVYKEDRRAAPAAEVDEQPRKRKAVTALVNEEGMGLLRALEAVLGYSIDRLEWADPDAGLPELSEAGLRELAQRISGASGPNVLLVPEAGRLRVLSYN